MNNVIDFNIGYSTQISTNLEKSIPISSLSKIADSDNFKTFVKNAKFEISQIIDKNIESVADSLKIFSEYDPILSEKNESQSLNFTPDR